METEVIIGFVGVVVMIVLLFLRMWIGIAMLLIGFVGYAMLRDLSGAEVMISIVPFSQASFYTLTTVPVFIFMGQMLLEAGIGRDLYDIAYKWVGHLRGGLVLATVPACAAFGAITGVPTPASVSLGRVALPEMRKYGYIDSFSTSSIVASSGLSVLIPPSIPMIVYGMLTESNIAELFIAGILPGILLAILFMITILLLTRINPKLGPAGARSSWRVRFSSLKLIWPTVALFLLVLGGIYLGWVTPTEAGALGAFGTLILTAFIIRRLSFKHFINSLKEAAGLSCTILLLIIGAQVFGRFLALSGAADLIVGSIVGLDLPTWGIFALLILLYVGLGCILDIMSAVIITMPVVYPAILAMGLDPIWFGVIIILTIQMGLLTPPIGLDVFILGGAIDVPIGTIFRGVWPYVVTILIAIAILFAFPQIVLLLPMTMR